MNAQSEITAQHKNIHVALAAAQAEMGAPIKGSVNPAFRSKYADLADVVNAVSPALTRHGIAFWHHMSRDDSGLWMTTVLSHGASETGIECPVPLLVNKQDMHGLKSAVTYAKRIGLESVTGVAPEDDDGNAAANAPPKISQQAAPKPPQASAKPAQERTLTKPEGETILAAITACETPEAVGEYMQGLRAGPMAFAADHPKIKAAAEARIDALAPFPGDQAETHPALVDDSLPY